MIRSKIITSVIFPDNVTEEDINSLVSKYSAEKTTYPTALRNGQIRTTIILTINGTFLDYFELIYDYQKLNATIIRQYTEPISA
jgi:hypothetical protein